MLESFSYSMAQLREKFLEAGSAGEIPAQDHCIREIAQNGFELGLATAKSGRADQNLFLLRVAVK